jgi:hypothetical protein
MWNDKPDGYPIPVRNPTGMGTDTNFYPQPLCWRAGNCSTRPITIPSATHGELLKLFLEMHGMLYLYVVSRNLGTIEYEPLM